MLIASEIDTTEDTSNNIVTHIFCYTKVNDVESYTSIESCLQSLEKDNIPDVFIIGGEMIYNAFFEYADTLHITFISDSVNGIDTFFPIPMDKIKISYQIQFEEKLSDNCIYTMWNKK